MAKPIAQFNAPPPLIELPTGSRLAGYLSVTDDGTIAVSFDPEFVACITHPIADAIAEGVRDFLYRALGYVQ
jgi:hypothetical protein